MFTCTIFFHLEKPVILLFAPGFFKNQDVNIWLQGQGPHIRSAMQADKYEKRKRRTLNVLSMIMATKTMKRLQLGQKLGQNVAQGNVCIHGLQKMTYNISAVTWFRLQTISSNINKQKMIAIVSGLIFVLLTRENTCLF